MMLSMLRAKISHATITDTQLHYEGSIVIDQAVLEKVGLLAGERVQILNTNTGSRFDTYILPGQPGGGQIGLRGPAARLGQAGDKVMILSYGLVEENEAKKMAPKIVTLGEGNKIAGYKEGV